METHWAPGVNNNGNYGRWAGAEFTGAKQIQSGFASKVECEIDKMIEKNRRMGRSGQAD